MFISFLLTTPAQKDDLFDFCSLVVENHTADKIDKVVGNLSLMISGDASGGIPADKSEGRLGRHGWQYAVRGGMFIYFLLTTLA